MDQLSMARAQAAALSGQMAFTGSACQQSPQGQAYWQPQGLELLSQRPLPSYSAQDAKLYGVDAKLADCQARRKAAIMWAAQEVGQPYP